MSTNSNLLWLKEHSLDITTPFEDDFWDRKILADRLTDYVSRLKVGATIAIDAEWGTGKSWFVQHWQAQLKQQGFSVIYLNAFNQDYIDDPFLTIAMEITNAIDTDKNTLEDMKGIVTKAYRALLPNMPMLIFHLFTTLIGAGKIATEIADTFKNMQDNTGEFGEAVANLLNEKLEEHLSAQVENYEKEKQSLNYFKAQLTKVTTELDQPLVFIIDELDRCKPEFAIRLIERIKHFFDIPNVVFILAIHKKQLEQAINSFYGFTTADNYLEKFIDFSIMLKNRDLEGTRYQQILEKYNHDLKLNIQPYINYYVNLCKNYTPNPRQLIRIINKFSLLKSDLDEFKTVFLFLMLLYIELNLIQDFNEQDFINHFYTIHQSLYKNHIDNLISQHSEYVIKKINQQYDFFCYYLDKYIYCADCSYIGAHRKIFEHFLYYIEYVKFNKDSYKDTKHTYYPTDSKPNSQYDLIETWYKYIHIIID